MTHVGNHAAKVVITMFVVIALLLTVASAARADHTAGTVTIPVTSAWGGSGTEVALSYEIQAGSGVPASVLEQVDRAIASWNDALADRSDGQGWSLQLVPFTGAPPKAPDVTIHVARGGGPVRGFNLCRPDSTTGLRGSCRVAIAGQLMSELDLDDVYITAWHELGHALGLGHADQPEDPMCSGGCASKVPDDGSGPQDEDTIHCDVDGVVAAHHWLTSALGTNGAYHPHTVGITAVVCRGSGG